MDLLPFLFISLLVIVLCLYPIIRGHELELSPSAASIDPVQLEKQAKQLVDRFIHEEKLFKSGQISRYTWRSRQAYLENCYVDVARRLDLLTLRNSVDKANHG